MNQTYITLNDGNRIPQFGLGVYMVQGDAATELLVDYGYSGIKTQEHKKSAKKLADIVAEKDSQKHHIDLFITGNQHQPCADDFDHT